MQVDFRVGNAAAIKACKPANSNSSQSPDGRFARSSSPPPAAAITSNRGRGASKVALAEDHSPPADQLSPDAIEKKLENWLVSAEEPCRRTFHVRNPAYIASSSFSKPSLVKKTELVMKQSISKKKVEAVVFLTKVVIFTRVRLVINSICFWVQHRSGCC